MSGMGELWPSIKKSDLNFKEINAVDISPNMNKIASKNKQHVNGQISILQQDILNNDIPTNSADLIVSSFGLKTFNTDQLSKLAREIKRILKPGGSYSFVEISVPSNILLRFFYMIYLKWVIPVIGFLFQGNSSDYRMLGIYTSEFGSCESFHTELGKQGLESNFQKLFFGCATITWGKKVE
jgi:demethylmenaquinone methyltransferase/2-methoxy-6-polyprenyl-1,4-benzoquinol methylase